jgi:hypothetical protein
MTKLEELLAACHAAKSELNSASAKYYDAYGAYQAELKKQKDAQDG